MFCTSIVVAIGHTKQDNTPYLFRSYVSPPALAGMSFTRNPGFRDHYPIWMVARATSAAPSYLRDVDIEGRKFVDGAIGFNNPTEELHDEVEYLYGEKASSLVLSIGTGTGPPHSSKFKGGFGVVKDALGEMTDCEKIHQNMDRRSQRENFEYQRFNVKNDMGKIKIGAYKELPTIKEKTERYLQESNVDERLRTVARILVANRRNRITQNGDRWEAFCCDIRYQCPYGPHKRCKYGYHERTRHRFVEHLERDHGITNSGDRETIIDESKNIFLDLTARRMTANALSEARTR